MIIYDVWHLDIPFRRSSSALSDSLLLAIPDGVGTAGEASQPAPEQRQALKRFLEPAPKSEFDLCGPHHCDSDQLKTPATPKQTHPQGTDGAVELMASGQDHSTGDIGPYSRCNSRHDAIEKAAAAAATALGATCIFHVLFPAAVHPHANSTSSLSSPALDATSEPSTYSLWFFCFASATQASAAAFRIAETNREKSKNGEGSNEGTTEGKHRQHSPEKSIKVKEGQSSAVKLYTKVP
eukprot:GHVT01099782.1.p1 GENE.GHVT01099782.1~~GHVT01099782.1.p1  ORF type:complete len:238 (-),score=35.85 GHVT01099782.1:125-838(-)